MGACSEMVTVFFYGPSTGSMNHESANCGLIHCLETTAAQHNRIPLTSLHCGLNVFCPEDSFPWLSTYFLSLWFCCISKEPSDSAEPNDSSVCSRLRQTRPPAKMISQVKATIKRKDWNLLGFSVWVQSSARGLSVLHKFYTLLQTAQLLAAHNGAWWQKSIYTIDVFPAILFKWSDFPQRTFFHDCNFPPYTTLKKKDVDT